MPRGRTTLPNGLARMALLLGVAAMAACGSGGPTPAPTDVPEVEVGPVRRVTSVPYAFEPYIAVDPTDSDRLAAVAIAPAEFECDPEAGCPVDTALATSDDRGGTWLRRALPESTSGDPVVAYGSDGTPYVAGLTDQFGVFLQRGIPGTEGAGLEVLLGPQGVESPG